jgi:stage II sporulation protein D
MLPLAALVALLLLLAGGDVAARGEQLATTAEQVTTTRVLTLSVSGRGWGHGVGMGQWGAHGFARQGASYAEILAHYYRGTQLGKADATRMRVLLVERAKSIAISSAGPLAVTDASGAQYELAAGRYSLGPGFRLEADPGAPAQPLPGPLVFAPRGAPLAVNGKRYRGTVELAAENGALRAVNAVPMEAYLPGVVPSEMPSSWPAEALKAQAVAARSYALATRKPSGPFDAYADVRSQVYGGIDAEHPATSAAVQATAREIVLYQGKVAITYFFSTSGGKTADVTEVWPGSQPVPYLVSVPDPYDNASPHHTWGPVAIASQALRSGLKLAAAPVDARVKVGASGRASQLVLTLANGGEAVVPAATVRSALGLRSTWFRIGVLALQRPATTPVTFGTRAKLGGLIRSVKGVTLERKGAGGIWEKIADVRPGGKGVFEHVFKGERTADYRLATATLKGAPLRVPVAPSLKLRLGTAPGTLEGTVRPVFAGTGVVVQRQEGTRWLPAGTALVDERGAFQAVLDVVPGTYRARLAPRAGYAAALSRPLSVGS